MSFFGSLTGSTQRKDIRASQAQANQYLENGYNQSQEYYNQAAGLFSPYMQQGQQGGNFYNALMGLNGNDARSKAQATITSDPLWSGKFAQDSKCAADQHERARRWRRGNALVAASGCCSTTIRTCWTATAIWAARALRRRAHRPASAPGQGDNAYGYGATKAANALNTGNAIAGTRGIGVNNLMGLLGTGMKAYSAGMGGVLMAGSYFVNLPRPGSPAERSVELRPDQQRAGHLPEQKNDGFQERAGAEGKRPAGSGIGPESSRSRNRARMRKSSAAATMAMAIQNMADNDPAKAVAWQRYLKEFGDGNHSPEEMDFRTGPKIAAAAAGSISISSISRRSASRSKGCNQDLSNAPLERRYKEAQIKALEQKDVLNEAIAGMLRGQPGEGAAQPRLSGRRASKAQRRKPA